MRLEEELLELRESNNKCHSGLIASQKHQVRNITKNFGNIFVILVQKQRKTWISNSESFITNATRTPDEKTRYMLETFWKNLSRERIPTYETRTWYRVLSRKISLRDHLKGYQVSNYPTSQRFHRFFPVDSKWSLSKKNLIDTDINLRRTR